MDSLPAVNAGHCATSRNPLPTVQQRVIAGRLLEMADHLPPENVSALQAIVEVPASAVGRHDLRLDDLHADESGYVAAALRHAGSRAGQ